MQGIFVPLLAGLLGTAVMTLLLMLPHWMGLPRVDLIRAVGSYVTKNRETAFGPGMAINFVVGILFGYAYYWGYRFTGVPLTPLFGMAGGVVHGALVMLFAVVAILEHHPDKRYQQRGPMTAFAQLLGHIVYGLVVGTVCWNLAPNHLSDIQHLTQ